MRSKIQCDGESTVLLQNFLDLNWAVVPPTMLPKFHALSQHHLGLFNFHTKILRLIPSNEYLDI
jgi:hypothetical protein